VGGQGNRRVKDEKEIVGPTPRRFGQGQVMRRERPIADAQGGVGRPWQTLDTLARMERQGSITAPMRRAGNRFHDDFRLASLDPLFAGDPRRISVQLKSSAAVRPHDWGNRSRAGYSDPRGARQIWCGIPFERCGGGRRRPDRPACDFLPGHRVSQCPATGPEIKFRPGGNARSRTAGRRRALSPSDGRRG
jgi:hypothetical protein